jgi:ketosteroid isomerase-like protein
VAGDYDGKAAVGGYVGTLAELSGGTLRFEPHDVTASEAHGVGLVRDLAERGDKILAMNNVHVWHISAGQLAEIWIYPGDVYAWDEFWSD